MAQETRESQDSAPIAQNTPTTTRGNGVEETEASASRYPCRVPIRMSRAERATIGKKACALNLSISRFLVERGIQDKQGNQTDPARLRYLHVLFQDAADKARALLQSPLFVQKSELTREARARLEEAAYLLSALSGELARRLS